MKKIILGIFTLLITVSAVSFSYMMLKKQDTIMDETKILSQKYDKLKAEKELLQKEKNNITNNLDQIEEKIDDLNNKINYIPE
ncbi:hypothetical protein [Oceanirhabdus sp. W0125-5]|uniref:hypothetical protein n=1 Tax=Oceanirhabdus sp. W0125-5 TaxID=2999116 RepID=UPI0022F3136A|nr:hypothetical protein [Oceanirhabdus sp. W0125-5]WBW98200.1 hypothetical protein OW730_05390 [Oceanirhabdus sp. W0125-5]